MIMQPTNFTLRKTVLCVAAAFAGMLLSPVAVAGEAAPLVHVASRAADNCLGTIDALPISTDVTLSDQTYTCEVDGTLLLGTWQKLPSDASGHAYSPVISLASGASKAVLNIAYASTAAGDVPLLKVDEKSQDAHITIDLGDDDGSALNITGKADATVPTIQLIRSEEESKLHAGTVTLKDVSVQVGAQYGSKPTHGKAHLGLSANTLKTDNSIFVLEQAEQGVNSLKLDGGFGGEGLKFTNTSFIQKADQKGDLSKGRITFEAGFTLEGGYAHVGLMHNGTAINPALMGQIDARVNADIKVGSGADHAYQWGEITTDVPDSQLAVYSQGVVALGKYDNSYTPVTETSIVGNVYVENEFSLISTAAKPFVGMMVLNNTSEELTIDVEPEGDNTSEIEAFIFDNTADEPSSMYLKNTTWKVHGNSRFGKINAPIGENNVFDLSTDPGASLSMHSLGVGTWNFKLLVNPADVKKGSIVFVRGLPESTDPSTWNINIVLDGDEASMDSKAVRVVSFLPGNNPVTPVLKSVVLKDGTELKASDYELKVEDFDPNAADNAQYAEADGTSHPEGKYRPLVDDVAYWFDTGAKNIVFQKKAGDSGDPDPASGHPAKPGDGGHGAGKPAVEPQPPAVTNCLGTPGDLPITGRAKLLKDGVCSADQTVIEGTKAGGVSLTADSSVHNVTLGYGDATAPEHSLIKIDEDAENGAMTIEAPDVNLSINGVKDATTPTVDIVRTGSSGADYLNWSLASLHLKNAQFKLGFGSEAQYTTRAALRANTITLEDSLIDAAKSTALFLGDDKAGGAITFTNSALLSRADDAKIIEITQPLTVTGTYASNLKILKKHGSTDGNHVLISPALMGGFNVIQPVNIQVGNADDHSYVWGQLWREGVPTEQLALYATGTTHLGGLNGYTPKNPVAIQGNVFVEADGFVMESLAKVPLVGQFVVNRSKVKSLDRKKVNLDFEGTEPGRYIDAFLYDTASSSDFTDVKDSTATSIWLQNMTWKVRGNSRWQLLNGYDKTTLDLTVNHGSSVTLAQIDAASAASSTINFTMYVNPRSKKEGSMLYVLSTVQNQTWSFDLVVDGNKAVAGMLHDTPVRIATYKSDHTITPVIHSIVAKEGDHTEDLDVGDFVLKREAYNPADEAANGEYEETDATKLQGQYRPSINDTKIWFKNGYNLVLSKIDAPDSSYQGTPSAEPDYEAEHKAMTTAPASATSIEEKAKKEEEKKQAEERRQKEAADRKAQEVAIKAQVKNVDSLGVPQALLALNGSFAAEQAQTAFASVDPAAVPAQLDRKTQAMIYQLRQAEAFNAPQRIGVRTDIGFVSGQYQPSFTGNRQALTISYNTVLPEDLEGVVALEGQRASAEFKDSDKRVNLLLGGVSAGLSMYQDQLFGHVHAGVQFGSAEFKQGSDTVTAGANLITASVEGEYRIPVQAQLMVAPTAQLVYSRLSVADRTLGAMTVKSDATNNFSVRLGARAEYSEAMWSAFASAQLRYEAVADNQMEVTTAITGSQQLTSTHTGVGAQLGAGAKYHLDNNLAVSGGVDYLYLPDAPVFVNVNLGVNYQF